MNVLPLLLLCAVLATAYGCDDMQQRIVGVQKCQQAMMANGQQDPCGALATFETCGRGYVTGCPMLETQLANILQTVRSSIGDACGPGPSGGNACDNMPQRMAGVQTCQQAMAGNAQQDPCGAMATFESCAREHVDGCPMLETELANMLQTMRSSMGGMCGPSEGGDSESSESTEVPTEEGPTGPTCNPRRAMRKLQRCRVFLGKLEAKGQSKRCRASARIMRCIGKVIAGCPKLTKVVEPLIVAARRGCDVTTPAP